MIIRDHSLPEPYAHRVTVRSSGNDIQKFNVAAEPGSSDLHLLGQVILTFTKDESKHPVKTTRRPSLGALIRVLASPSEDEWTGYMVGEVKALRDDCFVLDAGTGGTWEVAYTNSWEEVDGASS